MPRIRVGDKTSITETDDTEGQGFRYGGSPEVEDDTEGNNIRVGHSPQAESDDTEGHAGHARFVDEGQESDDTEGNSFRGH